ncbi:MAG: hypothetical protein LBD41_07540, partial [Clostridiales Family XIII bacterium]|nr:hypothetical protein [Clostridiales Family XIII bacterium]
MIKLNLDYNRELEKNDVVFVDINSAYIEKGAKIAAGSIIYPLVFIDKKSVIEENVKIYQSVEIENTKIDDSAVIRANSRIQNSRIGSYATVEQSIILDSEIGDRTKLGPFAYIRPNTKVGSDCKIGDFVEIKNSIIGNGTKISHLTYVGDSDLGEKINLGCGVVFVNYDGQNKYRSTVEDSAFIGCNVNII